jgi:hypothetical protein
LKGYHINVHLVVYHGGGLHTGKYFIFVFPFLCTGSGSLREACYGRAQPFLPVNGFGVLLVDIPTSNEDVVGLF